MKNPISLFALSLLIVLAASLFADSSLAMEDILGYKEGIVLAKFYGLTKYDYDDLDARGLSAIIYDKELFDILDKFGLISINILQMILLQGTGTE